MLPSERGVVSASLEGSRRDSTTVPRISASLEGSEPTLRGVTHLRFARDHPSAQRDKQPCSLPARRTEALSANHSSTVLRTDGVRPAFPTMGVTGVPSANSGHCSAIPNTVAALWNLRRGQDRLSTAPITIPPTPVDRTPPRHTYGPGPASCSGRGPVLPRAPQGGMLGTSSRRLGPPTRGVRDLHVTPRPP